MQGDLAPIDDHLAAVDADGYLIEASSDEPDQAYLSGFWAPGTFVTLYTEGEVHCLVSPLEFGRAKSDSAADSVVNMVEYDYFDRLEEAERHEAWAGVIAAFCADHDIARVAVPGRFPLVVADELRANDLDIVVDFEGAVRDARAVKTEPELEAISETQAAAEAAMATAESMLAEASIDDSGVLQLEGDVLTSERVKIAIERTLLDHRCSLDETIVAGGAQSGDPHHRGSGPLHAGELIVIDIFPRHKETHYCGDLTRTFVKGEPKPIHETWYEDTKEALDAALATIAADTTGEAVHAAVCQTFEDRDHPTLRSSPETTTGFIHSTGHGVGLAVHEAPSLSISGEELRPNHVVTVEPGLYDPDAGGVRIEDLVVVTADGYHNLTEYPKRLVVE